MYKQNLLEKDQKETNLNELISAKKQKEESLFKKIEQLE